LLYRFDLAKGDSVRVSRPPYYFHIDTVFTNYNNSGRKLFHVKDPKQQGQGISNDGNGYLEGLGPTTGFLSTPDFFPFEDYEKLMCYNAPPNQSPCPWFKYLAIDQVDNFGNSGIIYPNPASSTFTLKLPAQFCKTQLSMMNIMGQSVFESECTNTEHVIDVRRFPAGLYFLDIKDGAHILATHKLVIRE